MDNKPSYKSNNLNMDNLIIIFKIIASAFLVLVSVYSAIYFTQINRIEEQFGLKIPVFFKKVLGGLTMIPMAVSLAVLVLVLAEVTIL